MSLSKFCENYYTIPSNNRELRLTPEVDAVLDDYTIPSNNRELRQRSCYTESRFYYTIPSNNRELRQDKLVNAGIAIIPYQVITGNYDT